MRRSDASGDENVAFEVLSQIHRACPEEPGRVKHTKCRARQQAEVFSLHHNTRSFSPRSKEAAAFLSPLGFAPSSKSDREAGERAALGNKYSQSRALPLPCLHYSSWFGFVGIPIWAFLTVFGFWNL